MVMLSSLVHQKPSQNPRELLPRSSPRELSLLLSARSGSEGKPGREKTASHWKAVNGTLALGKMGEFLI